MNRLNYNPYEYIMLKVEQNDSSLTKLTLSNSNWASDFNRLGRAIATNTNISLLEVYLDALFITGTGFYDGLKKNKSISELVIKDGTLMDGTAGMEGVAGNKILQAYQENSASLTSLRIMRCNLLQNQGYNIITTTLRRCAHLQCVNLFNCNIADDQLIPMVEAIRGLSVEQIYLNDNSIGDAGCEALATLVEDPNYNLKILQLSGNEITNDGLVCIINSLSSNTRLRGIALAQNLVDPCLVVDTFSKLLCNTKSINDIYLSNHTLGDVIHTIEGDSYADYEEQTFGLESLVKLNRGTNKGCVVMKKFLKYHPVIDMELLFEWGSEDDERNLKALPYVVDWFDKASLAVEDDDEESYLSDASDRFVEDEEESYDYLENRKLSAIFQFARAMPLQFVPTTPNMILFHKYARDQLKDKKMELERQIVELEEQNETIKQLDELPMDSISNAKMDDKKRKRS